MAYNKFTNSWQDENGNSLGLVNTDTNTLPMGLQYDSTGLGYTPFSDVFQQRPMGTILTESNNTLGLSVPKTSMFSGLSNLNLSDVSTGLSALTGLANAYTSFKNYGLSKDIYKTEKKALATNLANQAKTINNDYTNSAKVGLAMSNLSDEEKAKVLADTEKKFVKGTL
jgi:hypothetical protein